MIHRFALSGADQPHFDEPEDLTDTTAFLQWRAQYAATGLVLHWNPAKAERRGVWQNPSFVSWNWYPANRWTPPRLWGGYIPWQFFLYRRYITAPHAYGTLQAFSGWDEPPALGESKPLDYYYPGDALTAKMRRQFRQGLGASFKGYLWFVWSGANFPDSLSQHPNWRPVNRSAKDAAAKGPGDGCYPPGRGHTRPQIRLAALRGVTLTPPAKPATLARRFLQR